MISFYCVSLGASYANSVIYLFDCSHANARFLHFNVVPLSDRLMEVMRSAPKPVTLAMALANSKKNSLLSEYWI